MNDALNEGAARKGGTNTPPVAAAPPPPVPQHTSAMVEADLGRLMRDHQQAQTNLAVANERRGMQRAMHAVEEQALNWHKLAEDLGSVLLLVLDRPGVRELVPDGLQARAAKLLARVERADGAEVEP